MHTDTSMGRLSRNWRRQAARRALATGAPVARGAPRAGAKALRLAGSFARPARAGRLVGVLGDPPGGGGGGKARVAAGEVEKGKKKGQTQEKAPGGAHPPPHLV